ncbi:MAG: hypothetical protein MJA83_19965 [Gammaproteobacteria bacterium]|nr:hypothetical protein [Gammaproteobacteria bacterium]
MGSIKYFFIIIALASSCYGVYAAPAADTGLTKISRIGASTNGIFVAVVNGNNNPSNCSSPYADQHMFLPDTAPGYDTISAALMGAHFAGKDVVIVTQDCTSVGYSKIRNMSVY